MPENCYTDHPQWPAWLAAVSANPDDDNVRKACAEWLYDLETESATARADFITRQCDYAQKRVRRGAETDEQWRTALDLCRAVETGDWLPAEFDDGVFFFKTRPLDDGVVMVEYEDPDAGRNPWISYDRGFASGISGPLRALHGTQCQSCGGERRSYFHPFWTLKDCPQCKATGRNNSLLRSVLRREPLAAEGVLVSDRSPYSDQIYYWFREDRTDNEDDSVPNDLYPLVVGEWGEYRDGVSYYRRAAEAYRCLSRGLYLFHLPPQDPRRPDGQPQESPCPTSGS